MDNKTGHYEVDTTGTIKMLLFYGKVFGLLVKDKILFDSYHLSKHVDS